MLKSKTFDITSEMIKTEISAYKQYTYLKMHKKKNCTAYKTKLNPLVKILFSDIGTLYLLLVS